ncbi:MAG: 50S ribosomal protein L17 [Deltaproteobacteria bacterium]|jgi:large subunit ribosomal protein L17|nr:50S ribosomal protein L17 [Deltaproteobacteria bacterium]
MRHLKAGNRLGVTTAHRLAMMRNMVTSIIENGQITCTLARAKEVRKPLEKMIGLGKRGTLHARRQALSYVKSKDAMGQLFGELAERYKDRQGGYCRIIKLGKNRLGDNSEMAILQLLGSVGDNLSDLKSQKGAKKKQKKKESTVLKEVSEEIQNEELTQENSQEDAASEESAENIPQDAEAKGTAENESNDESVQQDAGAEDTVESELKAESAEGDDNTEKEAVEEESKAETSQVQNDSEKNPEEVHDQPEVKATQDEFSPGAGSDTPDESDSKPETKE